MKALLITPNGIVSDVTFNNLDDLQCYVGGYIQGFAFRNGFAYINEEGKLKGMLLNTYATTVAHEYGAISADDYIVGNMLIVGKTDGNETDVPQNLVEEIRAKI